MDNLPDKTLRLIVRQVLGKEEGNAALVQARQHLHAAVELPAAR